MHIIKTALQSLILFCLFSSSSFAQEAWLTDIDTAKIWGKKTDQLILFEVGSVRNGTALFIANEIWNDSIVEAELVNFIPVSLELDNKQAFFRRNEISFSPTIIIMDHKNNVLYKDPGFKSAEEIANILSTIHNHGTRLHRLVSTYKRGSSQIGRLQKAEEYLYLAFLAPNTMKMYFYKESRREIEAFNDAYSRKEHKKYKDRRDIIELGQEICAGDFYDGIEGLSYYEEDETAKSDKILAYFYSSIAAYIDEDNDKSKSYRIVLAQMAEKQVLARDYVEKLDNLLGEIE